MFRDRFAINAAYAMIEKRPENFERAKARIRSNFRMLIDLMIEESGTIPGYQSRHPYVIGEQTLSRALSKICPLWPICD